MSIKLATYWIIWLILTSTTISLILSPTLIAVDDECQIRYTLWMDLNYRAENGSYIPIIICSEESSREVNGTVYTTYGIAHVIHVSRGSEEAVVLLDAKHYILAYVLVNGTPIYVHNLATISHSINKITEFFEEMPFKPEPTYSIAYYLDRSLFHENIFFTEAGSLSENIGELLLNAYYNITGEESGVFDAYLNVTTPLIIYTGCQTIFTVHKWTMLKLKIYYENLTIHKTYLKAYPYHTERIKLKTIPLSLIRYANTAYRILLPISILMLLIGLIAKKTRNVIKRYFRIILAIFGIALLLAAITLRIGPSNVGIVYIGLENLIVNGEPWPGQVHNNVLLLNKAEGVVKPTLLICHASSDVTYMYIYLATWIEGEGGEEIYRTYHPWSSKSAFSYIINRAEIPLEHRNACIELRAIVPKYGTVEDIQTKILSINYTGDVVEIKLNPQLIVDYEGPMLNEINVLLAIAGTGIFIATIIGYRSHGRGQTCNKIIQYIKKPLHVERSHNEENKTTI